MSTETPQFTIRLGVVALRVRDEQLCALLVKRSVEPGHASWTLPGGFARKTQSDTIEALHQSVGRDFELQTGASLGAAYLAQLGAYTNVGQAAEVLVAYLAIATRTDESSDREGTAEAQWLPVSLVLDGSLQVERGTKQILADGVGKTRELLETTALGLYFCEQPFTIPTLRRAYEIVWGLPRDTLDPGAFHRRLLAMPGLVEQVDREERSGPGRPANLYVSGPLVRESGAAARLERIMERPWQTGSSDMMARPVQKGRAQPMHQSVPTFPVVEIPSAFNEWKWGTLLREARRILWTCGRTGTLIHYGELALRLDMHVRSAAFFDLLDALCIEEARVGGPMITALVTNKRTGMPGQRFFVLADRLGRHIDTLQDFIEEERLLVFEWMRAHPERALLDDESSQDVGSPASSTPR